MEISRLYEVQRLTKCLDALKERQDVLAGLSADIPAIDYAKDRVQSSPKQTSSSALITESQEQITQLICNASLSLVTAICELEVLIAKVPEKKQRDVLIQRYIKCKTMAQVSTDLEMEYRYCKRVHRKALDAWKLL